MKKHPLVLALLVAGCVAPVVESESIAPVDVVGRAQVAQSCQIVDVRRVQFSAPITARGSYGSGSGPRQQIGTAVGAAAGYALGEKLGGGDAALIGALLGSMAGAQVGAKSDLSAPYSNGLEVTVRVDGRTMVVTQGLNPGDRPLYPGNPCRLVSGGGKTRVQAVW